MAGLPFNTIGGYPGGPLGPVELADGVVPGNLATVSQIQTQDQQAVSAAFSLLTASVPELLDPVSGLLNRGREAGQDQVQPIGIGATVTPLKMYYKVTSSQVIAGGATASLVLSAVSGTISGVPWAIGQGAKLLIDNGTAAQETATVKSVNTVTNTVTFTANLVNSHNGSVTPFTIFGAVYNEQRDAAGEGDGGAGAGLGVAVNYLYSGGDTVGNFDRWRSAQAKSLASYPISGGYLPAGSTTLTLMTAPPASGIGSLQPRMKVWLVSNPQAPINGAGEVAVIDRSYIPGSVTVPLATATINGGLVALLVDRFSPFGGLSGGSMAGVPVQLGYTLSLKTGLIYPTVAYDLDGVPGSDVPMTGNGLAGPLGTIERWRSGGAGRAVIFEHDILSAILVELRVANEMANDMGRLNNLIGDDTETYRTNVGTDQILDQVAM